MQTLYALHRCAEANFHIGTMDIREDFAPDLTSMEVQDKVQLNAEAETAISLFTEHFSGDAIPDKSYSDKVKESVTDAITQYEKNLKKDESFLKKQMIQDAERIHDWYLLLLLLLVEFKEASLAEIEEHKERLTKKPVFYSANFSNNRAVAAIQEDTQLETRRIKNDLNWEKDKAEIKTWFKTLVKADESFIEYEKIDKPTWADDAAIIGHILKAIILKSDGINSHIAEIDSNWDENRHIAKGLLKKTIKNLGETQELELMDLSYNWDEDKEFFIMLFDKTRESSEEYETMISERTKNWDIERVAIVDKVILKLAISEMINFSSIPVKVTINEYLELAKTYSTPKSKQFINGILDKLATQLQESGIIKKSGRGLIDNK